MVRIIVVGLVAVMVLFAGPMSAAYAGGMGIGDSVAFQCYLISGASPGGNIDLADQFGSRNVKLGVARLICAPVIGTGYTVPGRSVDFKNPSPPTAAEGDHLKCYDIRSSKDDNPAAVVKLEDFFRPLADGVQEQAAVGGAQFLCVGAIKALVP